MFVKGERCKAAVTTAPSKPSSHLTSLPSNTTESQKGKNPHLEKSTSTVVWPFDKAYHLLVSECDRNISGAGAAPPQLRPERSLPPHIPTGLSAGRAPLALRGRPGGVFPARSSETQRRTLHFFPFRNVLIEVARFSC